MVHAGASGRITTADLGLGSVADLKNVDPAPFYSRLREAQDPVWDQGLRGWVVSHYDLQQQVCQLGEDVLRFPFVVQPNERVPLGLERSDWLDFISHGSEFTLLVTSGELHRRHRGWWIRAFSPKVLASWEARWALPIAHAQINRFINRGRADLYADYAERVSPRIMSAALGLPTDEAWVDKVVEEIFHHVNCNAAARSVRDASELPPGMLERGRAATRNLRDMMRPHVEARRSGEGDDFISLVWRDADELFGPQADHLAAVTAWSVVAFMGGAETSAACAGTAFQLLLSQPGLLQEVSEGGEAALEAFVEEGLRLGGPADLRVRVAATDFELNGVAIARGEPVIVLMQSGNRDPAHYPDPQRIDLTRPAPRDHLAFAKGARTCPGNGLARLQLRAIFKAALERLKDLRLDDAAPGATWQSRFVMRRLAPVNVTFEPAP